MRIRALLDAQVAAWNRYDVARAMDFYWRSPDLEVRYGNTLDVPGFKASMPPADLPAEIKNAIALYWQNLPRGAPALPSPNLTPARYGRFFLRGRPATEIRFSDQYEAGGQILDALIPGEKS